MADPNYPPGSRAIKIPLSRMKHNDPATSTHRRTTRDDRMQRTDSNEGSDASISTASSSRTREGLLHTQKTVASPANMYNSSTTFTTPDQPKQRKDKQKAQDMDVTPPNSVPSRALSQHLTHASPLSPSMLSSSSYKSINLSSRTSGDSDEPARIITYTKHSQGFTWNDELFLPSYLIGRRYGGRGGTRIRRRWDGYDEEEDDDMDGVGDFDEDVDRCPVMDIFVTDEEAAALIP